MSPDDQVAGPSITDREVELDAEAALATCTAPDFFGPAVLLTRSTVHHHGLTIRGQAALTQHRLRLQGPEVMTGLRSRVSALDRPAGREPPERRRWPRRPHRHCRQRKRCSSRGLLDVRPATHHEDWYKPAVYPSASRHLEAGMVPATGPAFTRAQTVNFHSTRPAELRTQRHFLWGAVTHCYFHTGPWRAKPEIVCWI